MILILREFHYKQETISGSDLKVFSSSSSFDYSYYLAFLIVPQLASYPCRIFKELSSTITTIIIIFGWCFLQLHSYSWIKSRKSMVIVVISIVLSISLNFINLQILNFTPRNHNFLHSLCLCLCLHFNKIKLRKK